LWRSTCARRRTVSTLVFSARRARRNALMFTLGNYAWSEYAPACTFATCLPSNGIRGIEHLV
jgi:hypothetical protein